MVVKSASHPLLTVSPYCFPNPTAPQASAQSSLCSESPLLIHPQSAGLTSSSENFQPGCTSHSLVPKHRCPGIVTNLPCSHEPSLSAACEYLEGLGGICVESARCSAWHRGCLSVSPWISLSYLATLPCRASFLLFLHIAFAPWQSLQKLYMLGLVFPLPQESFEYVLILSYLSG